MTELQSQFWGDFLKFFVTKCKQCNMINVPIVPGFGSLLIISIQTGTRTRRFKLKLIFVRIQRSAFHIDPIKSPSFSTVMIF